MLRRTLVPWKAAETIREALAFCRQHRIDEIIWKIDVEEFSHGLPTLDRIRSYLPWLQRAFEEFGAHGIVCSINPWTSLNHGDRGRDNRGAFPDFDWFTDQRGVQCRSCACPLSPAWQEYACEAYRLYASVQPSVLWVEDDFRLQGHAPAQFGCFCERHLAAFSERAERRWDREPLVAEVLKPGAPSPVRGRWLEFLAEGLVAVAGRLERAVHAVSPQTRLGLMHGEPTGFTLEGRRWAPLTSALSGPHEVVARPGLGNYSEGRATALAFCLDSVRQTRALLPPSARVCPELENWNYSEFNKSATYTRLQLLTALMAGASEITLNLFDHLGSPMAETPGYGEMLAAGRGLFDEIARSFAPPPDSECGLALPFSEDESKVRHLPPGAGFADLLMNAQEWSFPLQYCGIPVTYRAAGCTAVSGQYARLLDAEAIRAHLGNGLLLDGSAAAVLLETGYGAEIGIRDAGWVDKNAEPLAAEHLEDPAFGGGENVFTSLTRLTADERFLACRPVPEARVISRFVDPDRRARHAGMLLFENARGGRIAVYPFDLTAGHAYKGRAGATFYSRARQRQLQAVAAWLCRGRGLCLVQDAPLGVPLVRRYADHTLIGLANLSTDSRSGVTLRLSPDLADRRSVEILRDAAGWRAANPAWEDHEEVVSLTVSAPLRALDVMALRLRA